MKKVYISFCLLFLTLNSYAQKKVLLFVSHEETYYSEYIVALKSFEAAGYEVDVRSATTQPARTYMIPTGTTIEATANTLTGSSYSNFTNQFLANFGTNWQASFNATPNEIITDGSIQDIQNMDDYAAFVIAGGTGILAYRVDGSYESQGQGNRLISTQVVSSTAQKLNALALDALSKGKVVLAQCHGASLPVFWRIPNTTGTGAETLGISLLKNQFAAGYPQAQTDTDYSSLSVNYLANSTVQIASPNSQFSGFENAKSKLITSRDWYPQTVSFACRTVLNILESYPSETDIEKELSILIVHGGAVNSSNCHHSNRANDIPCNYGTGTNLPADFTDLRNVLNANSVQDNFNFIVSDLNLTSTNLPFNPNNENAALAYFSQFDGIIFYKHWSTGITNEIQNALVDFVDNGGGILGLHHGLYNDIAGSLNKNILINDLFGISSEMNTWSANLTNFQLINTNYGHFVSSYQIPYQNATTTPSAWNSTRLLNGSNTSFSAYPSFFIYDEIYNNMAFLQNQTFGRGENQVYPLFSNNISPNTQMHTSGFLKQFNKNLDNQTGKLAYFIVGERKESLSMNHSFGQIIRNAVYWTSSTTNKQTAHLSKNEANENLLFYPNPATTEIKVRSKKSMQQIRLVDVLGNIVFTNTLNDSKEVVIDLEKYKQGVYFIEIESLDQKFVKQIYKSN